MIPVTINISERAFVVYSRGTYEVAVLHERAEIDEDVLWGAVEEPPVRLAHGERDLLFLTQILFLTWSDARGCGGAEAVPSACAKAFGRLILENYVGWVSNFVRCAVRVSASVRHDATCSTEAQGSISIINVSSVRCHNHAKPFSRAPR